MPFHQRVPSSSTTLVRTLVCKGGSHKRPVRKSPLLHGRKSTPTPKCLGMTEAYFFCQISPKFQISLIYAFIGCPQSVDRCIVISSSSKLLPLQILIHVTIVQLFKHLFVPFPVFPAGILQPLSYSPHKQFDNNIYLLTIASFRIGVPSILFISIIF